MLTTSYVSGASDTPLIGQTIGDLFDQTAGKFGDRTALVSRHQGLRFTYAELQEAVNRCARGLIALGLKPGDRIGMWSPNYAEWVIIQFATAKAGTILVNINPSYRSHELEYALNQSGCTALVTATQFKSSDYTGMLYDLAPELNKSTPGQLQAARLPALRTIVRLGAEASPGMFSWEQLMALGDTVTAEQLTAVQSQLQFDDAINIQYTSGTTGYPKGATLSHHNILNNGYLVGSIMRFSEQDKLIIPVPMYHCFGMVLGTMACVAFGATMMFPSDGFDPLTVLAMAEEEKATAIHGVPTMFIAELEHPEFTRFDLSSLRTGLMAGSPCPIEVMKQVIERMNMREVEIAYGMTETSPVSFQTRADAPLDKRVSTVGQVLPHTEVKIIDSDGRVVPAGEMGELCTRGYCVMLGYWNDEARTREAIDAGRWMHTGDLAVMDAEGYVNIVGRIKDMLIRGGENIYPREIEEFLYSHPKISDVQVIGVPDQKYGEEVMAWVKLREGEVATAEEIRDYCRGQIAHYKVPRYIKFVDGFPMTVTGKIRKVEMRQVSIEELDLGEAAAVKTA
ncbi:MAG: AMP-binding protein [Ardenticatenales bacterium]|nr:AMP-binding protein [Ardenticatenales bacterium]